MYFRQSFKRRRLYISKGQRGPLPIARLYKIHIWKVSKALPAGKAMPITALKAVAAVLMCVKSMICSIGILSYTYIIFNIWYIQRSEDSCYVAWKVLCKACLKQSFEKPIPSETRGPETPANIIIFYMQISAATIKKVL